MYTEFARVKLFKILLVCSALVLTSCNRKVHKNTRLLESKLMPCPNMPNCVVSQYANDKKHYREPFKLNVGRDKATTALKEIITEESNASLATVRENYLHAEYKIPLMGFIDDVEFYFPEDEKLIHYRSASRVGYSDLGVNKKRIKKIEKLLIAKGVITD